MHHDYIVDELKAGVTQATIHQRLRDEHGLAASVASVKRYVAANLPEEVRRDQVVVLRDEADTPPGEEAQIDYGHLGYWVDPATGQAAAGVGVRDGAGLLAAHVRAAGADDGPGARGPRRTWRRSRSSAACRAGWCRTTCAPGWTSPTCTTRRSTGRMPSWPSTTACWSTRPGRGKPRDKARVERPMPYVRDSFWRGREFTSLAADAGRRGGLVPRGGRAAGRAGRWRVPRRRRCSPRSRPRRCNRCRSGRSCWRRGRRRRSGRTSTPRSVRRSTRCRGGSSASASTPARPSTMVQIFHNGQLIATHGRKPQGKQTDFGHYPPEKIAFRMRTPTWCRTRAAEIGPACAARHRRPAGGQRPVPAARRPGRARPGRQTRPGPAGSRLRQGDRGR